MNGFEDHELVPTTVWVLMGEVQLGEVVLERPISYNDRLHVCFFRQACILTHQENDETKRIESLNLLLLLLSSWNATSMLVFSEAMAFSSVFPPRPRFSTPFPEKHHRK